MKITNKDIDIAEISFDLNKLDLSELGKEIALIDSDEQA